MSDEQVAPKARAELIQRIDEIPLAHRPGRIPQRRIDYEQWNDPAVTVGPRGFDRGKERRIVTKAKVASEPHNGGHTVTVGGRYSIRTRS